jgi:thiol-disulfide isomerase/thioredoxin
MFFSCWFSLPFRCPITCRRVGWALCRWVLIGLVVAIACFTPSPAFAALTDDRFDGDIFALYAGNGSLVPPRVTLEQAQARKKPTLLVFYADDSSDCKQYVTVVSNLQAFYGRAADFIALRVDALPLKSSYQPTEPGYYYKGYVPQTILFDQTGQVRLDETGNVAFEAIDDVFRQVFDLLPRQESVTLKRRAVNEVNTELR